MPPKKKPEHKLGETVFGLWPGSGGLYFKAVVVEVDADNKTYDVKFEEGTTYTLLEKHVKKVENFVNSEAKSTTRATRSRRRSSSRSRSRSRSRTPARRNIKRENPGSPKIKEEKVVKETEASNEKKVEESIKASPEASSKALPKASPKASPKDSPKASPKASEKKSEVIAPESETEEKADVDNVPLSRRRVSKSIDFNSVSIPTRRSTRIARKTEVTKLDTSLESNGESKPVETQSKEMECDSTDSVEHPSEDAVPKFQTLISTSNIFLLLSSTIFFHLICLYNKCSIMGFTLSSVNQVAALWNPFVSLFVLGYFMVIAIMTQLPVGQVLSEESGKSYRSNAMATTSLILLSGVGLINYFKLPASWFLVFLPQCIVPTLLLGLVLALIISFQTKENGKGTHFISHLNTGSTENAIIAGVNIKIFLNRIGFLSVIILNSLAMLADFERKLTVAPTLLISSSMQIIYSIENLLNEKSTFISSYEFTQAKLGWLLITTYLTYPFLIITSALYINSVGEELPYYCLVPIVVLFLEGLWIKLGSNKQKNLFSSNPEDASFSNMESLSSPSGEKLLISGWWGWLRHPDYLGVIIMHLSFILPCGLNLVMPFVFTILTAAIIERTIANEKASKMNYGPSWDRYCQRVPSCVLPHIY